MVCCPVLISCHRHQTHHLNLIHSNISSQLGSIGFLGYIFTAFPFMSVFFQIPYKPSWLIWELFPPWWSCWASIPTTSLWQKCVWLPLGTWQSWVSVWPQLFHVNHKHWAHSQVDSSSKQIYIKIQQIQMQIFKQNKSVEKNRLSEMPEVTRGWPCFVVHTNNYSLAKLGSRWCFYEENDMTNMIYEDCDRWNNVYSAVYASASLHFFVCKILFPGNVLFPLC